MDLFAKYKNELLDSSRKEGIYPYFHELQSRQAPEVVMEGHRTIMLGSNNYLGLTENKNVIKAGIKALKKYGTGCSGSRFLNGTLDLPGGFIDIGENAEKTCERELKEETGLILNIDKLKYLFSLPNIYSFSNFNVYTLDLFYEYLIDEFRNLNPSDDVDEILFVDKNKLDPEKFGLKSIKEGIKKYINEF